MLIELSCSISKKFTTFYLAQIKRANSLPTIPIFKRLSRKIKQPNLGIAQRGKEKTIKILLYFL
jgi:hypothetical protein